MTGNEGRRWRERGEQERMTEGWRSGDNGWKADDQWGPEPDGKKESGHTNEEREREREAGMARARSGGNGVTQTERDTEGERERAEQ